MSKMQQDDPAWTLGQSSKQAAPRTSQRKPRGRKPIPSPTAEELADMSAADKTKQTRLDARRIRDREGAARSKEQKKLEQQVKVLKSQLTTKTAELEKLKAEFEEYKAQQQQNISPFSSSAYYLGGAATAAANDLGLPPLHPDDPMNPAKNTNGNNSNITNPSTPTTEAAAVAIQTAAERGLDLLPAGRHPPPLQTATTAPHALGGEPDLNSVMQWKYPGYYDSNMQYHPFTSYATHHLHHLHGIEVDEPPLVFTPFATVTSPREALMLSPGGGNMRSTEFSAWRPRDYSQNHHSATATTTTTAQNAVDNNNNGNSQETSWWAGASGGKNEHYTYFRENSNTARELVRMLSSPAALNNSGPLFAAME